MFSNLSLTTNTDNSKGLVSPSYEFQIKKHIFIILKMTKLEVEMILSIYRLGKQFG